MPGTPNYSEAEIKSIEKAQKTDEAKRRKLKKVFDRFKNNPSTRNLLSAYNEFVNQSYCRFIRELRFLSEIGEKGSLDEPKLPKEFEGIEYEIKLDVQVTGKNRAESNPQQYLEALQNRVDKNSGFLSDGGRPLHRPSENFYYGKGLDDMLVVMRRGNVTNLKYKEDLENLCVGLNDEEFIFKREEKVDRNCSDEDVFREMQRVILNGGRYKGKIVRDRARTDFLSSSTGRMYTIVFDICEAFKEDEKSFKKRQIEVEYMGYIPGLFKKFREGSEKQIARDLLNLTYAIQEDFMEVKIGNYKIKDIQLTKERKYDFLIS